MTLHTTAKNLREYNARLKKDGESIEYIFAGYMQSSGAGYAHKTRHYIARITEGQNSGATTGDYKEIVFNSDFEGYREY